jgi:putative ATP-dependent endonuclease of the OLD family
MWKGKSARTLLPALRDAVGDLANWRKSPPRPLLDKAAGDIDRERLQELADGVSEATSAVAGCDEVREVGELISNKLVEMVGSLHALEMCLGFSPTDGERLLRRRHALLAVLEVLGAGWPKHPVCRHHGC